MFKVIHSVVSRKFLNKVVTNYLLTSRRTFLSQAYYCQEVWDHRLNDPILQKQNLEELYYELDQRFQKTRQVSAVDVDIFVNTIKDSTYNDEILDVVHKLRLSADTGNTLESTSHAVVRALTQYGNKDDLLQALDDRLNYGIFLDFYTANLLLDIYWKNKDFTSGARVASQLMLQEDFDHPLSKSFSLLHCYNFLLQPEGWPEHTQPEEPEEEVKIRVRYLRNPYDDDHFDLKDPKKIVGKTLYMFTKGDNDPLNRSLNILGLALYNKIEKLRESVKYCLDKNVTVYKEVIELMPEESKPEVENLKIESTNVQDLLKTNVEKAVEETAEIDIANQCKLFSKWENDRKAALEEQKKRLLVAKRLANIEDLKQALKEKETKLWFFSNQEQIELEIEEKEAVLSLKKKKVKARTEKVDENYIPPEVHAKRSN